MSDNIPLVGSQAPDFNLDALMADGSFGQFSLSTQRGKYVVLFFYPLDFTFVCPTEITAFSDQHGEFAKRDAVVAGVSIDSKFSHLAWTQMPRNKGGLGKLEYPLLSDLQRTVASDYGVLDPEAGVALRGLFIIDPDGVVQHATINALNIGRSVDETLRVLSALRHTREHPDEVCPIGWVEGQATMKPDPVASQEYFAKVK